MKENRFNLGCAFSSRHLFENFPCKKLHITCKLCEALIHDCHRERLAARIFRECLKIVFDDIVENNVTFWLPISGTRKANIHMRKVDGEAFKKLRRAGKWKDVDILKSYFCGYLMSLFMLGRRTPRVKSVYLNKYYTDKVTLKTNESFPYGDGVEDRYVKDYYEQVYALFPKVPKSDILRILKFGWRSLYLHNSYGGDTLIRYLDFWCYIGNLKKNPLDFFHYYIRKLTVKLRVLYKRRGSWDGYYYFALSEKLYLNYLLLKNRRGRPRKHFTFGSVLLFLILDECKITLYWSKYIFRIPYISPMNMKIFEKNLVTDKAELIITRDTLKFKDIKIYYNNYEYI